MHWINLFSILCRNAGNAILHPLFTHTDDRAQNGHFKVFRSGHLGCDWSERHHHGYGILHDAKGKIDSNLFQFNSTRLEEYVETLENSRFA